MTDEAGEVAPPSGESTGCTRRMASTGVSVGPANSRFLEALRVVLANRCNGTLRCKMPTKELQLVSLEFCQELRCVPNLHLRVGCGTPHWLLAAGDVSSSAASSSSSSSPTPKESDSTRVPSLRARSATWNRALSAELSQPISALANVELLIFGYRFNGSLACVEWPRQLERLEFDYHSRFDQPIDGVTWPTSLKEITFGCKFNQSVDAESWPKSLEMLSYGAFFDQPIAGVVWPDAMQQITFGTFFNQPVQGVAWPKSLRQLTFGAKFNQPVLGTAWPRTVKVICFGSDFNHPIHHVVWPDALQQVTFGCDFNHPIRHVVWPDSLEKITLGADFNHPVEDVAWPASLNQLAFGRKFYQDIGGGLRWPRQLKRLTFVRWPKSLEGVAWPASLEHLKVGGRVYTSGWPSSVPEPVYHDFMPNSPGIAAANLRFIMGAAFL